jgi:hypothetical protein
MKRTSLFLRPDQIGKLKKLSDASSPCRGADRQAIDLYLDRRKKELQK